MVKAYREERGGDRKTEKTPGGFEVLEETCLFGCLFEMIYKAKRDQLPNTANGSIKKEL